VIKAALERAGLKPDEAGTVIMGNVIQADVKMNPGWQAAILAGLPMTVPAMTVNRVCGSGAQAIVSAAEGILLGTVDVAVAGGMENMDLAPYLVSRGRWGYRMGHGQLYDSMLRDGLNDAFSDEPSGWHTEDLVQKFQISRDVRDQWALRSQQRFAAACSLDICRGFTTFRHRQYITSGRSGLNHGWVADDVCWRALGERFSFNLLTQQCYEVLAGGAPSVRAPLG
jgi:acetyl-CoA C-acetyltransferase